ncbi:MAG: hydrogenase maturation nickel metallochaperone HypA [Candidatus Brocadiia bacterium]
MHELSLSQGIVSTVLAADGVEPERLTAVTIEVGALSAVNVSSLEFCMRLALDERGMEQTSVEIRRVPARLRCRCGRTYETEDMFAACPECGGFEREVIEGMDVNIPYVEVQDEQG